MVERYAITEQESISFIGSEAIYDENDRVMDYQTALLTSQQAANFISNDDSYEDRACVSINTLFLPYSTYPKIYGVDAGGRSLLVFPSGNMTALSGVPIASGYCNTTYDYIDSDAMFPGNVHSKSGVLYSGEVQNYARLVGINKDAFFVGYSADSGVGNVAGPLNITWNNEHNNWMPNIGYLKGFVSGNIINKPSSKGLYTDFYVFPLDPSASGGYNRSRTFKCRNYDDKYSSSRASGVFVIAVQDRDSSGIIYNLPIYIGCA